MRAAMGPLALLAIIGGCVGVPGLTDTLEKFLEPTFEDSRFADTHPTDCGRVGRAGGGRHRGHRRHRGGLRDVRAAARASRCSLADRFGAVHNFLIHKWYFDELFDAVFVRPLATAGSFGRRVIETEFVQGFIVGGATGVVRAGTSIARAVQTGYLRAYALLLLFGAAALLLYFLIAST